MTAPQSFTRHTARVEAMRLDDYEAICRAGDWAEAHGLFAVATSTALGVHGQGAVILARIGQWLAYNPTSGEFTVWDPEHFQAAHSEVTSV